MRISSGLESSLRFGFPKCSKSLELTFKTKMPNFFILFQKQSWALKKKLIRLELYRQIKKLHIFQSIKVSITIIEGQSNIVYDWI